MTTTNEHWPVQQSRLDPLYIPVVLGSIRKDRLSYHPARLLMERTAAAGHKTALIDLRELDLPMYDGEDDSENDPSVLAFKEMVAPAHAVVLHTPEYNHGYTSAIKNAIQYGPDLDRNPVAVCGLSSGDFGGVRAVDQLKLVLHELGAVPIPQSVYFSNAESIFDHAGQLLRPEFIRRIDYMLAELAWYAYIFAWGRRHLPIPEYPPS
jgi:NAD(P)H-dependent FMN reductase